jgi:AGZA family xanthine/uracil permease-like MFS transporter
VIARLAPALRWYAPGDWNAFFGLALDNLTQLVILSSLLIGAFGFPADLVLTVMVPGTALGVLAGDLVYTELARRLMRRRGRADVTAMPFGIDTPTLFAMVFGVLGPVKLATGDPVLAWKVGMGVTIALGVVKLALAWTGEPVRRALPRAALLGSIAGVATLLIAFLPVLRVIQDPLVGLTSLTIVLVSLTGRLRLPGGLPGAFAAVAAGTLLFWLRAALGGGPVHPVSVAGLRPALPWPTLLWWEALPSVAAALPLALPFALATVVGGIDNTESAAAAGDEYRTRDILLTEAGATILAGLCGGVIQNTPYIGHPAYKAMGARAGYTLATGLVIGLGAATGAVGLLVALLPEAAVAPVLVFVGLEITAQAFLASPRRHAAAVASAFLPAVAALVLIQAQGLLAGVGKTPADVAGEGRAALEAATLLGNGFVLTALVWAAAVAWIIDQRLGLAAAVLGGASLATLVGLIHSPAPGGAMFLPWTAPSDVPIRLAGAYGVASAVLLALAPLARGRPAEGEPG